MEGPKKPRFSAPYIQLADLRPPRGRGDAAIEGDGTPLVESSSGSEARSRARDTSVISRKELARELRREAYQRAKKARAVDPRHLALKEAAKQRRREVYQEVKKRRKAQGAELEAKHKSRNEVAQAQARSEAKRQLAERVKSVIAQATEPAQSLARDIERALQSPQVSELMERLARESPTLAAKHRDGEAGS